MFRVVFNIAKNTWRECLREPIFVILQLTALAIIGTYPVFALFVFRQQEKLVTDGGLATTLLFGWITAVLSAGHVITREIDSGTVSLILAKPVNRGLFMLAKILGVLGVLTLSVWCNGIATLLALRIAKDQFRLEYIIFTMFFSAIVLACIYGAWRNFTRDTSFSAATAKALAVLFFIVGTVVFILPTHTYSGYDWSKPLYYPMSLIVALLLVLFAVWALGTLAVALSTRFSLVSNLTICFVIFMLGLLSDYIYSSLTAVDSNDMILLLQDWPWALPPFLLLCWLLTTKHFHARRQRQSGHPLLIHLSFALPLALILARIVSDTLTLRELARPSTLMRAMGQTLLPVLHCAAELFHSIIPNWQLFWVADALAAKKIIPLPYVCLGAAYIFLFIILFAILAFLLFISREVGRQMPR